MKNSIGWFLIATALAFFLYGVYNAIHISWDKMPGTDNLPVSEGLDAGISSISAILLTNLGAVLGISITNRRSALARSILIRKQEGNEREIIAPVNSREQVQMIGVLIYILSLTACFVTWIHNDFSSDPKQILPFVSQSAKMFIGVITAYLTLVLGVE